MDTNKRTSQLSGFYNRTIEERIDAVARQAGLSEEELATLRSGAGIEAARADQMIENVVGIHGLPLGIAVHFAVNGRDVLVPMAIEEPSVVAGASYAAKMARASGGFQATASAPEMIGQVQVLDVADLEGARRALLSARAELLALADETDPLLVELGGGARDLEVRVLEDTPAGPMLIVHLIFDCRDAMGANAVNTACERLAPQIEQITGGRVVLRILSNLADRRLARAECSIEIDALARGGLAGEQVAQGIVEAWAFAAADPYRAATHNKGILNGVDAVVVATGNDWRAVEAGAHAYAARSGRYAPLSTWNWEPGDDLTGTLEMPLAVGIVGGATRTHPTAQVALDILGVETARELAEIIAAVGLAQNLAALRALASEGIQRGHMRLHARQMAVAAGARVDEIGPVVQRMTTEGVIRSDRAEAILTEIREG